MGRPSKLRLEQWENITTRVLYGDHIRALSREFGFAPSTISERISEHVREVKSAASLILEARQQFQRLSISEQILTIECAKALLARSGRPPYLSILRHMF